MSRLGAGITLAMIFAVQGQAHGAHDCEALKALALADTSITVAESHAAGVQAFTVRGIQGRSVAALKAELPAYCRVVATIRPTTDSSIQFELWMPTQKWNHRYQQVGNGGLAGSILVQSLIEPLRQGWAVAGTDDGHVGSSMNDGQWALGHPEKVVDYGYRAVHLTAQRAEALVSAYYRTKTLHAYFVGCSDGGRESLMEAQRFPRDFDGFLAGAPAIDIPSLALGGAYAVQTARLLGANTLSAQQLNLVRDKALERCDALDGVQDGVIADPLRCAFRPRELVCQAGQTGACLTAVQADVVQRLYDGLHDSHTSRTLAYGLAGTLGTNGLMAGTTNVLSQQVFGMMVYADPKLTLESLDLIKASSDAETALGPILNAADPNLRVLRDSGKKLIQYHGWADPMVPVESSIAYFNGVQKLLGDTRNFYRLFLAPGMGHCGGGVGPAWVMGTAVAHDARHDAVTALTRWVEQGVAPEQIVATEFVAAPSEDPMAGPPAGTAVRSTRPLCPFPQVAAYKGQRSTAEASNFECRGP